MWLEYDKGFVNLRDIEAVLVDTSGTNSWFVAVRINGYQFVTAQGLSTQAAAMTEARRIVELQGSTTL